MQKGKGFEQIEKTAKFGIDLSLDRISVLMNYLDNPQDKLKYVHVAGTNGKGSTCALLQSILTDAGYKTGKFISPHLECFNERISINGVLISDDELKKLSSGILEKTEKMVRDGFEHPTQFEIICAMAFFYFYQQKCDIVVLEVGLGGRLDATNIIKNPLVSVITTIAYDHTDRLGNTLGQIAGEKAGIIKGGGCVVSAPQESEALKVIENRCKEEHCKLAMADMNLLKFKYLNQEFQVFDFEGYKSLALGLMGEHQLKNAATAIKAVDELRGKGFVISDENIYEGVKNAINPGRFEVLGKSPEVVIDGAHNINGITALKDALTSYYSGKRIILVMAVLSVKDYEEMVGILAPLADICIASEPVSENALPAEKLADCFKRNGKECLIEKNIPQVLNLALEQAGENDVICLCGSLYFIGHVRTHWLEISRKS
ncbi:MAG: bifunctional folylpolyglutamate synthase/dihydrofolate synthase [Deltaproteobacteria bacterium]